MKKWDIYVAGDINIDLMVPGVDKLPPMGTEMIVDSMPAFVGGGAALFAMGTAKLGMKTVFKGSVGLDFYGTFIREKLKITGVDDSLLADKDGATGISLSFTGNMDRCFITYPGTNAGINSDMIDLDDVCHARHIHLTGYEGASNHEVYKRTLSRLRTIPDLTISMDVGWDPTGLWSECIFELFPLIDVMLMNEEECLHYTRCENALEGVRRIGECTGTASSNCSAYAEAIPVNGSEHTGISPEHPSVHSGILPEHPSVHSGIAVVKLGKRGSIAYSHGRTESAAPYPVQAVDPTGAGDSFNAGFITGFLMNKSLQECLRMGNICGAMSVTAMGGNTGFPTMAELKKMESELQ